jgi:hypothetical protein
MAQVVQAASQSANPARVLADRIFNGEGAVVDAVRIAAANILLVLCAHIAIPLPFTPVPVTGQTFGVLLVAVLLGSQRGMVTCVLDLLEGMAGLPVFQPLGAPGPLRLAGPLRAIYSHIRQLPSSRAGSSSVSPPIALCVLRPFAWQALSFPAKRLFLPAVARGWRSE